MALKEKNPTPTNIVEQIQKQVPQGPPSNPQPPLQPKGATTFSSEELKQIQDLQKEMNRLIFNFGQLKMSEIKLESSRKTLESNLGELEKKEKNLANTLNKKYGKGTLDIETGKFIPTE
jgi:hypothetical protein